MPPTEIQQTVSAADYDLMLRYFYQEPWGPWRDNVHAGLIASTVLNALCGSEKKRWTFQDFMLLDEETYKAKREANHRRQSELLLTYLKAVAKPKNG